MPDPNKGSATMQAVRAMSKAFIDNSSDQKSILGGDVRANIAFSH
jgi:hypothetical protein